MASDQPPAGPSGPLDLPKIQFFLKNQHHIQTWAEIANIVWPAVQEVIQDLARSLESRQTVVEREVLVGRSISTEPPTGPVLHWASWDVSSLETPDVGIAIGWDKPVDPAGDWPGAKAPYVGILTAHGTMAGQQIKEQLKGAIASGHLPLIGLDGRRYQKGYHWSVYRELPADRSWWTDVDRWREWLMAELLSEWDLHASAVDAAVSAVRATGTT